jgi:peptidoglycan/xylan/chitin deacetylase (PgdA/CDA1 family)
LNVGPLSASFPTVAGAVLGLAFLGAVAARRETRGAGDLALVAVALLIGAAIARLACGPSTLRVAGGLTALIAAWLLPQRTDGPSAAILGAFFGAGVSLAMIGGGDHTSGRGRRRITATVLLLAMIGFAAYVGAETPSAHWFGGGITHGPAGRAQVALTFDDGPNLSATLPIMNILDAAGVKGTFFEVGKAIDAEPQITRELYSHGQLLGNHSYHHDQWRWLDPRYPELARTQKAFQRAIGVCPAYYRPPHGDRTPFIAHVASQHHMRIVMWDDSSGDWAVKSPRTIARRIVRGAHPGAIIVLHDGLDGNPAADREVLVRALPLILDGLRAKHLSVVGLDRLIGGPAYVHC